MALLSWHVSALTKRGDVCSGPVPCITLRNGVAMPMIVLGTGASSYLHSCIEALPNPPCVLARIEHSTSKRCFSRVPSALRAVSNRTCFIESAERAAVDWLRVGGTAVETAQVDSNQMPIGRAIKRSGVPREKVFVEAKCFGSMGHYATLVCAFDALEMLQVDYIDLLLLHQPFRVKAECIQALALHRMGDPTICNEPLFEDVGAAGRLASWRALELLLERGLVRAIGVAGFDAAQLLELLEHAAVAPHVLQTHWAPTSHDDALRALCVRHGVVLQAWGALGAGQWSRNVLRDPAVLGVAERHGASAAQVVLRWSVQQNITVLAGTGNVAHSRGSAAERETVATRRGHSPSLARPRVRFALLASAGEHGRLRFRACCGGDGHHLGIAVTGSGQHGDAHGLCGLGVGRGLHGERTALSGEALACCASAIFTRHHPTSVPC